MTKAQTPTAGPKDQVLLIPSRDPQHELAGLGQILSTRGFGAGKRGKPGLSGERFIFDDPTKSTQVELRLLMELGVMRLLVRGEKSAEVVATIGDYLPVMPVAAILKQLSTARSQMEVQLFTTLVLLAFPDAKSAMRSVGQQLLDQDNDDLASAVVQGLLLLESPDAMPFLRAFAASKPESEAGKLAVRAQELLTQNGLAGETPEDLIAKAERALEKTPEKALEWLEEAAAAGVFSPRLPLLKARALRALGRLEEGLAALAEIEPGELEAESLFARGLFCEDLDSAEDAIADYSRVLELEPEHEGAKRGVTRLRLAAQGAAGPSDLAQLDEAVDTYPADPSLRIQRAVARMGLGRFSEALVDLAEAKKWDPDNQAIVVHQAEAELGVGLYAQALHSGVLAHKQAPPALKARAVLLPGRAYLALDEPERANAAFSSVARELPELPAAHLGRGIALELLGQPEKARASYETALKGGSAVALWSQLKPLTYRPLAIWEQLGGAAPFVERPPHKAGVMPIDPLFKRCLGCGASALGRRTSCKVCGGREFLS